MRHEVGAIKLCCGCPSSWSGLALGACLWWVTRRLFGNEGGYISAGALTVFRQRGAGVDVSEQRDLAALGVFRIIYIVDWGCALRCRGRSGSGAENCAADGGIRVHGRGTHRGVYVALVFHCGFSWRG